MLFICEEDDCEFTTDYQPEAREHHNELGHGFSVMFL